MDESRRVRVRRGTRSEWVEREQGKHFCGCGCGAAIPLRPAHYPTVPTYLHGHNTKGKTFAVRAVKPCECGCGQMASPGRRYVMGHNGRGKPRSAETRARISAANSGEGNAHFGKRGRDAAHWKGGRTKNVHGYIEVQAPDHPLAVRNGYIREHRLVAETHLRESEPDSPFLLDGYLHPGADVHHINEVKDDNRIENLEVMWRGQHTRHHLPGLIAARWQRAATICPNCADCAHRDGPPEHEAWWLALCQHFAQCPDDPDAFWNVPREQYASEEREAKLDPAEYLRERGAG